MAFIIIVESCERLNYKTFKHNNSQLQSKIFLQVYITDAK